MMLLPAAHPLRASATVVWFAAFLLLHAAFAQLPPEWQQAVEDSDLLFSPDDSFDVVPANIQATLGNGFLATQMRRQGSSNHSCITFLPSNAPPSTLPITLPPLLLQHRALYCRSLQRGSDHRSLPPRPPCTSLQHRHPSLRLQLPSGNCRNWYAPALLRGSVVRSNARAGLFLRSAFYERRLHVTSGLCQGCLVADVSQRWYAHRSRQNLMVMEVNVTYFGGSASSLPPLLLLLNNTDGGSSADFNATPIPPPSDIAHACADMTSPPLSTCSLPIDTTITIAETKTPEIQGGGVFTVAWAADSVPQTLQVNRSMPLYVFAIFYVLL
jgi:hypothetical protein